MTAPRQMECNAWNREGVFECASARDCSITHREAPAAAPGVLTDYVVEFVSGVRRAKATGAADVGRSNWRGVVECASAPELGMVDDVEIGPTRGKSRSASMFDGHVRLELTGVSDGAKRENVQTSEDAEIDKGVPDVRTWDVRWPMVKSAED
jgi:hypothetical protein